MPLQDRRRTQVRHRAFQSAFYGLGLTLIGNRYNNNLTLENLTNTHRYGFTGHILQGGKPPFSKLLPPAFFIEIDNKIGFFCFEIGRRIIQAASGNLKKVSLELGGKSPVIVFADADLDRAVAGAAQAIFMHAGQVCFAGSRLIVERPIIDEFLGRLGEVARAIRLGPSIDPETEMGPVISEKQHKRILGFFDEFRAGKASAIVGGKARGGAGFFVEPTVALVDSVDSRLYKDEIFGPVVAAKSFDDPAEALLLANDTEYGLAAGVFTRDVSKAHAFASEIEAGTVWVNCYNALDDSLPFGGFKQSGWGREGGRQGVEEYMEAKSVVVGL